MNNKQDAQSSHPTETKLGAGGQAKDGSIKAGKTSNPSTVTRAGNKEAKPSNRVASSAAKVSKVSQIAVLVACLALLCAAYAAYQTWLTDRHLDDLELHSQNQEKTQRSQTARVALVSSAVDSLQSDWQQYQQAWLLQQQSMDLALQQALQQMAKTQNQQQLPKWELAEAEYLLRLANQRLAMEQNPRPAIGLLQAADDIMRTSEQIGSYGVRQAIAKDISALTAVPALDVEGVYVRLASLREQAQQLAYMAPTVALAEVDNKVIENEIPPAPTTLTWQQKTWQGISDIWHDAGQELSALVRVQQRGNADQWLLTPKTEALLRMRLQLTLTQAQVALLRGQQAIYQSALQQATGLLHAHYRNTDTLVQAMQQQLTQLSQQQLLLKVPDISGSLYALQDLQAAIHTQQEDQ